MGLLLNVGDIGKYTQHFIRLMIPVMKGMLYWTGFRLFCDASNVSRHFKSPRSSLVPEIILIFIKNLSFIKYSTFP